MAELVKKQSLEMVEEENDFMASHKEGELTGLAQERADAPLAKDIQVDSIDSPEKSEGKAASGEGSPKAVPPVEAETEQPPSSKGTSKERKSLTRSSSPPGAFRRATTARHQRMQFVLSL